MVRRNGILWWCLLCTMVLLLWGCQPRQQIHNESTSGDHTEPQLGLPEVENPGNDLVTYDPERQIYILGFENVNSTIYFESDGCTAISGLIISRIPLDPTSIEVSIPIQSKYTVEIIDCGGTTSLRNTSYTAARSGVSNSQMCLNYYTYQCYLDVDFSKLGQLWREYQNRTENQEEIAAQFVAIRDEHISQFEKLKTTDTREFYVYRVNVLFTPEKTEEVFTKMDIVIGDERYHRELGSIRLIPGEGPRHYPLNPAGSMNMYLWMLSSGVQPYSNGVCKLLMFDFQAREDCKLENFYLWDEQFEILRLHLQIKSDRGNALDFYWDGQSPVEILRGDKVTLTLYVKNQAMAELAFLQTLHGELVYSISDDWYSEMSGITFEATTVANYHDLYAIIFDGVDMKDYYLECYYPIYEPWMNEFQQ